MGIEVKDLQTKCNAKRRLCFGLICLYKELGVFHAELVLFCSSDWVSGLLVHLNSIPYFLSKFFKKKNKKLIIIGKLPVLTKSLTYCKHK